MLRIKDTNPGNCWNSIHRSSKHFLSAKFTSAPFARGRNDLDFRFLGRQNAYWKDEVDASIFRRRCICLKGAYCSLNSYFLLKLVVIKLLSCENVQKAVEERFWKGSLIKIHFNFGVRKKLASVHYPAVRISDNALVFLVHIFITPLLIKNDFSKRSEIFMIWKQKLTFTVMYIKLFKLLSYENTQNWKKTSIGSWLFTPCTIYHF